MKFTDQLQAALSLLGTTEITIKRDGASPVILHPDRTLSIDGRRVPVTDYLSPAPPAPPAVMEVPADADVSTTQLIEANATIAELRKMHESLKGELTAAYEQLHRAHASIDHEREQAQSAREDIDQLHADLDSARVERADLERQRDEAVARMEEAQRQAAEHLAHLNELDEALSAERAKRKQAVDQVTQLSARLEDNAHTLSQFHLDADRASTHIATLTSDLAMSHGFRR